MLSLNEPEEVARYEAERESYDWAIARALAPLATLSEYLLPFVRKGGFMLAQKGSAANEEVEQARNAIEVLGGGNAEDNEGGNPRFRGRALFGHYRKSKR